MHLINVCKSIYLLSESNVDYEHTLSNKNLLSIDIVLLPEVHDVNTLTLNNHDVFKLMMNTLILELKKPSRHDHEKKQKNEMLAIIDQLKLFV
jgi:hypothetical protein